MRTEFIEKPQTRWQTWAKRVALRVLFPPVLLWDLMKLAFNKLLGETVGHLVLPATSENFKSHYNYEKISNEFNEVKEYYPDLSIENLKVNTYDGASLDTIEISHQSQGQKSDGYIINFAGNGMCYEQAVGDFVRDANELKMNVIGFNYRGVGHSEGPPTSKDDLVTDGIAQVQRLLNEGIHPDKIYLKGHSLGAGIATLVAKHFHDHGITLNLFHGRSFSSITNFVVGLIRTTPSHESDSKTGHTETFGGKLLGWMAQPFIKFALSLVKWEIEAADAFKALPTTHKEYMVVRSTKKERINTIDDSVIPHYASLHSALKDERREQKAKIKKEINNIEATIQTNGLFAKPFLIEAKNNLEESLKNLKQRKMSMGNSRDEGHNIDMVSLISRYDNQSSANTFFYNFVQKARDHHEEEQAALKIK